MALGSDALGACPEYLVFRYLKTRYSVCVAFCQVRHMPKSIHRQEYDLLRAGLRDARSSAGITQVDLSIALGRSQSFVSDIERGVRRLDLIEARDICRLLNQDFIEFVKRLESQIDALNAGQQKPRRRASRHS